MFLSIQLCEAESAFVLSNYDAVYTVNACNDGKFYILSRCGDNFKVTSIDEYLNFYETVLDVNVNENDYAYSNGIFYFFKNECDQNDEGILRYVNVTVYEGGNGAISKRIINDTEVMMNGSCAVDSSGRYYLKTTNSIDIYSRSGNIIRSIELDSYPCSLTASSDGNAVYCQTESGLKIISGDEVQSYNIYSRYIYDNGGNYFSTQENAVYSFSGGSVSELYKGFDYSRGNAVIGDCVLGIKNSSLVAVNNGSEISLGSLGGEIFICGTRNICGCFIKSGSNFEVRLVTLEDIENALKSVDSGSDDTDENGNNSYSMTSDVYLFNRKTKTLSGIEPETTIAVIKKNISSDSSLLSFFDKNGNIKSSGVIGTGASVQPGENIEEKYYLVIYGDLSGEGNINSNDSKILVDALLGKKSLDGVYFQAGDVNGDSKVDLRDYVALDNYMKGQYKIEQKR